LLKVIGRGTFGKVFLAEMKESKKLYAIKSIRKD
jgi:serine/threonine protein kinase